MLDRLTNGERAFLVALFGAIILAVCFLVAQGEPRQYAYDAPADEEGDFLSLSAAAWTAWFTAVLTVATILMRWDMVRTLKETKRSVDAHVAGQRGRIVLGEASIKPQQDPTIWEIEYSFMNIGNSGAVVYGYALNHYYRPARDLRDILYPSDVAFQTENAWYPLVSNGRIHTTDEEGVPGELEPYRVEEMTSRDHFDALGNNGIRILVFQGWIYYKTMERFYQCAFTMFARDDRRGEWKVFQPYGDYAYNTDAEIPGKDPMGHPALDI